MSELGPNQMKSSPSPSPSDQQKTIATERNDINGLNEDLVYPYFLDCYIDFSTKSNFIQCHPQQQQQERSFEWIRVQLRRRRKGIELKRKLSRVAGADHLSLGYTFDNSSIQNAAFNGVYFLKYKQGSKKLFISDKTNCIIRSMSNITTNKCYQWNGELAIEVGQPRQRGYPNGDRSTCCLEYPSGFDWDKDSNMYICNDSCICKVDNKTNQVSLVAGHKTIVGYKDGSNHEARFDGLYGILCYQQNRKSPLLLYVCDQSNHCIRMIDFTKKEIPFLLFFKTSVANCRVSTFAGKEKGDVDGTLQSARFYTPYDIVKDDENDHTLYVSDYFNHKIKMIDMKKDMVTTLAGDKNDTSILHYPQQMQIIDSFIYVACHGFKDCIVKIDKHSKQVKKIKFNDREQVSSTMLGITYHELDQCFYISDYYSIYKLE